MPLAVPDCVRANRSTCLSVLTQRDIYVPRVLCGFRKMGGTGEAGSGRPLVATGLGPHPTSVKNARGKMNADVTVCLFSFPTTILKFDSFSCIIFLAMSSRSFVILRHYIVILTSLYPIAAKKKLSHRIITSVVLPSGMHHDLQRPKADQEAIGRSRI